MARGRYWAGEGIGGTSYKKAQGGQPSEEESWHDASSWFSSSVRYAENRQQLTIFMPGWDLSDDDMTDWCDWFRAYLKGLPKSPSEFLARDVNVAENRLTGLGIQRLLETLSACNVSVSVLKLHHNHIEDGKAVADFIHSCQGSLRELHLSHNDMDTNAAADIVLAAAASKDAAGSHCYPRQAVGPHGASPLWLRLEQNYVSATELTERLAKSGEYEALGRKGTAAICNVSSKACTPHSCAKHRQDPPVVHAKHLANQRVRHGLPKPAPPALPAELDSQEILSSWCAGAKEEILSSLQSSKERKESTDGPSDLGPAAAHEESASAMSPSEECAPTCIIADVLRWDHDMGQWVKDTIEIEPAEPPSTGDPSGRVKLSQELGNKMGKELKSILGGMLKRPASGEGFARSPPPPPSTAKGAQKSPEGAADWIAFEAGRRRAEEDCRRLADWLPGAGGDQKIAAGSSRSSRRGSQPSSSDVKQANKLNPQATEFFPTTSTIVKATGQPQVLNPKAEEFKPTSTSPDIKPTTPDTKLPQRMCGISESLKHMSRNKCDQVPAPSTEGGGDGKQVTVISRRWRHLSEKASAATESPRDSAEEPTSGAPVKYEAIEASVKPCSGDQLPVPSRECCDGTSDLVKVNVSSAKQWLEAPFHVSEAEAEPEPEAEAEVTAEQERQDRIANADWRGAARHEEVLDCDRFANVDWRVAVRDEEALDSPLAAPETTVGSGFLRALTVIPAVIALGAVARSRGKL